MHAVPGLVDQPGDRGKGHLLGHRQHQCLEQQGKPESLPNQSGSIWTTRPSGSLTAGF
jgi:hypothetical protein